ncbi:hypothetical protein ACCO45_001916 [Purpureocillium lilacinum]|uniref:Uncharacterized protein n=1 Tax=Purpureocillium lilacinum TaxID=33203 RepID=A0ACC4E8H8_PURLI
MAGRKAETTILERHPGELIKSIPGPCQPAPSLHLARILLVRLLFKRNKSPLPARFARMYYLDTGWHCWPDLPMHEDVQFITAPPAYRGCPDLSGDARTLDSALPVEPRGPFADRGTHLGSVDNPSEETPIAMLSRNHANDGRVWKVQTHAAAVPINADQGPSTHPTAACALGPQRCNGPLVLQRAPRRSRASEARRARLDGGSRSGTAAQARRRRTSLERRTQ